VSHLRLQDDLYTCWPLGLNQGPHQRLEVPLSPKEGPKALPEVLKHLLISIMSSY